jgi:hypothetical protein
MIHAVDGFGAKAQATSVSMYASIFNHLPYYTAAPSLLLDSCATATPSLAEAMAALGSHGTADKQAAFRVTLRSAADWLRLLVR